MKRSPLRRKTPLKAKAPLRAKAPMKRATTSKRPPATKRAKAARSSKIRESARGQACQVRVPGVCNGDPSTTVLAHLNGAGMGMKANDIHGAYACSDCHAWLDGNYVYSLHTREERDLYHLQGMVRTQAILIDLGLIRTAQHDTTPGGA